MSSIPGFAGANCDWSGTFPAGVPEGTYYIGWIIDVKNDVPETNESNNTAYKTGYQLTVAITDIVDLYDDGEAGRSFSPTTVQAGDTFNISCDIRNGESDPSGTFVVKFYASTNTTISGSDHYIGSTAMSSISGGDRDDCDWSGTFPSGVPEDTYYIGWKIDANNDVPETNEYNNTAYKEEYLLHVRQTPVTIISEDFDGIWPGNWFVGTENSGKPYWGDNTNRSNSGSWSAYCADEDNILFPNLYENNMQAWMDKTNVSLVGYSSATLTFETWFHTETGYDFFTIFVKDQWGNWHNMKHPFHDDVLPTYNTPYGWSGYSGGWISKSVDLSEFCSQSGLQIQFLFKSDYLNVAEGVYIDDVLLTAF